MGSDSFCIGVRLLGSRSDVGRFDDAVEGIRVGHAGRLAHAVAQHLAAAELALVAIDRCVTLDLGAARTVTGLTYLPRQDTSANGTVGGYSVSLSGDGTTWGAPVSIRPFPISPASAAPIPIPAPVAAGSASPPPRLCSSTSYGTSDAPLLRSSQVA